MGFLETVERASAFLARHERVSVRALRRECELDDAACEELIDELVEVLGVARRNDGVIEWIGEPEPRTSDPTDGAREREVEAVTEPPMEGEQRQLTVLFCDLVDSTPIAASMDPEDYLNLSARYQRRARDVVIRHGGYVAHLLGDGVIAYFGFPVAHELDAEHAVRAGLDLVRAVGEESSVAEADYGIGLRLRVGIHTGTIVLDAVERGESRETLATGEAMHVAARLEALAEPNSVFVSAATFQLVEGRFDALDLGHRELRGVPRPVQVHQVTAVREPSQLSDVGTATPFVGRDDELGLLLESFAQVSEGRGQTVVISGEPGIGKSRLVRQLRSRLEPVEHQWIECAGSPYAQDSSLYPIMELQRQGLGFVPDDTPESKLAAMRAGLQDAGFAVEETLPLLAGLHDVELADAVEPLDLSAEGIRARTLALLVEWVLRLGRRSPTVLVLEDVHWMDPTTLEVLSQLVGQVPDRAGTARVDPAARFRPRMGTRRELHPVAPEPARAPTAP